MSFPAAIMVETQIEARAVEADAMRELRPLPVWCPLPRREDDPKVTCVGWIAGRQTARREGVVLTTSWCWVDTDTPPNLVSRPAEVLRIDRLPAGAGMLWALSRPRSLDWLPQALVTTRRFRYSLDLGAINARRAAVFAGIRWGGQHRSRPLFGRGWWLPTLEPNRREALGKLGALDDRFVLLAAEGADADEGALVNDLEAAVMQRWQAESATGVAG